MTLWIRDQPIRLSHPGQGWQSNQWPSVWVLHSHTFRRPLVTAIGLLLRSQASLLFTWGRRRYLRNMASHCKMTDKSERISNEAVMARSRYYVGICLEEQRKTTIAGAPVIETCPICYYYYVWQLRWIQYESLTWFLRIDLRIKTRKTRLLKQPHSLRPVWSSYIYCLNTPLHVSVF
jgi:hypothetical protein